MQNIFAGKVEFVGTSKNVVEVGEQFKITYTINQQVSEFAPPSINDFDMLSGISQSFSSSTTFINGKQTSNNSYVFYFWIQATKEGNFVIPPAKATFNGDEFVSNPISIKVIAGNNNSKQKTQTAQATNPNTSNNQEDNSISDNIFIKTTVSKANVYNGEQIIVTNKLYTRYDLADIGNYVPPTYDGFWSETIDENKNIAWQEETYNGKSYSVAVLDKVLLFPQKNGKIVIESMSLDCLLRIKSKRRGNSIFDDFFGTAYQTKSVNLKSNSVTINVKALPSPPSNFSGAVGSFSLSSDISKNVAKSNEAIDINVKIIGSGNLTLIDPLKFDLSSDFEVYEPKTIDKISKNNSGMSGSRTFEYLIIPRYKGKYKISSVPFVYFDINKEKYVSLLTKEFDLDITQGIASNESNEADENNKEYIKYKNRDIRYIKLNSYNLNNKGSCFFGSKLFYMLLILPLIIAIVIIVILKKYFKEQQNISLLRMKKANKVALKHLKTAGEYLNKNDYNLFYEAVSKALWGYLSDKLSVKLSDLSIDKIEADLTKNKVNNELIDEFLRLINHCEFARYSPEKANSDMQETYQNSINFITNIEKELKK